MSYEKRKGLGTVVEGQVEEKRKGKAVEEGDQQESGQQQ